MSKEGFFESRSEQNQELEREILVSLKDRDGLLTPNKDLQTLC